MRFPEAGALMRLLRLGAALPAVGSRIGSYRLVRELGRGGMGVVYEARCARNRPVALKLLLEGPFASQARERQFRFEARSAARLEHPHIVSVLQRGRSEGRSYFTMRLISGGSLLEELYNRSRARRRRGSWRKDGWLVLQLARAAHYAHARGLLHCDLKPANVLLDARGTPYLTDFGLCSRLTSGGSADPSTHLVGTLAYMAPEQAARDRGALTAATDVYGLGAILYELLTGRQPFAARSRRALRARILGAERARAIRSLNAAVPLELERICFKCLEKDAAARYRSAAALAHDLEAVIGRRDAA